MIPKKRNNYCFHNFRYAPFYLYLSNSWMNLRKIRVPLSEVSLPGRTTADELLLSAAVSCKPRHETWYRISANEKVEALYRSNSLNHPEIIIHKNWGPGKRKDQSQVAALSDLKLVSFSQYVFYPPTPSTCFLPHDLLIARQNRLSLRNKYLDHLKNHLDFLCCLYQSSPVLCQTSISLSFERRGKNKRKIDGVVRQNKPN